MFKYEQKLIDCEQLFWVTDNINKTNLLENNTIGIWHRKCGNYAEIDSTEMNIFL